MLGPTTQEIRLPTFEGPLELLLILIQRDELDITTISLAQVTDQYMAHLSKLERLQVGELAAFVVIAAKLLLIKSAALLPKPSGEAREADEVGEELVQQLQLYKRFKEVAALLAMRDETGLRSYVRIASAPKLDPTLDLTGVTPHQLMATVQEALNALPAPPVGQVVSPIRITINDQITLILQHLALEPEVEFREILSCAALRVEIIVTLQAVLELIKRARIGVQQEYLFGPIYITLRTPAERSPADGTRRPEPA
jgi:segregation and condensation protein A